MEETVEESLDGLEEEEELKDYRVTAADSGFATGVTFEELSTMGSLLKQEILTPAQEKKAMNTVEKLRGTEMLELLKRSMENSSQKIAKLLDKSLPILTDRGVSTKWNTWENDFIINNFT